MSAWLEIQLSEIMMLRNATWRIRAGDQWGGVGEKIAVIAGRVPVWIRGTATHRHRRFNLVCHFETEVASGSTVIMHVPSRQLVEGLKRMNIKAFMDAALGGRAPAGETACPTTQ
jgi:hypothetical protein